MAYNRQGLKEFSKDRLKERSKKYGLQANIAGCYRIFN